MKKSLIALSVLSLGLSGLALADNTQGPYIPQQCHVSWPAADFTPPANDMKPVTGIYWFNTSNPTGQETQMPAYTPDMKTANGTTISKAAYMQSLKSKGFFDPSKPTIIFVHGWQPGSTKNKTRFDFCYDYPAANGKTSPTYNVLGYWQGWNVGVFYWTPFADEGTPMHAEEKIYSTHGDVGMRWAYLSSTGGASSPQYCQNGMGTCPDINEDVTQMLEQAYQNALPTKSGFTGSELRIAGQSLGTQLAVQLTDWVVKNAKANNMPMPTRLSLMDPYMSPRNMELKEHLPFHMSVAQYAANTVKDIRWHDRTLPIDVYRTSTLSYPPTGDPAVNLTKQTAYMHMAPLYLDPSITGLKLNGLLHRASIYLYFVSKQAAPKVPEGLPFGAFGYTNADAKSGVIHHLMGQTRYQSSIDMGYIGEHNFLRTQDDIYQSATTPNTPNNNNADGNMSDVEQLAGVVSAANNAK